MDAQLTNELLQAVLIAPDERKKEALRILRGESLPASQVGPEPFLTLKDAATSLHFNPATLWKWGVPGHSLGGKRRFKLSEINAYLASAAFQKRIAVLREQRRQRRSGKPSI